MENYRAFFEQNYQGTDAFIEKIIKPVFGQDFHKVKEDVLYENSHYKAAAERANIQSIIRFGTYADFEVPLDLFDITLSENVRLSYSRVSIQAVVRQLMETHSAALIVFHYPDNTGEWRVSYVSKGSNAADATNAKRYTYLMGENQSCRTAAERFDWLASKEKTIKNITEAFSVEVLTKLFYKELFDWYEWAKDDKDGFEVTYPNDTTTDTDDRKIDEHLIRLITRLMFVWFIKQKHLIPESIFQLSELDNLLKHFDPQSKESGNYYNAILQNLFFGTLNKPISEREFASSGAFQGKNEHYGIKTLFRNANEGTWFKTENKEILQLFSSVPFLNGGLFECLDKEDAKGKVFYYDGFSRAHGRQKRAFLPNCLFFDKEKGIIPLLEKYNFTVEENSPNDVEVALDPELLGKVFENLLGAFNPETKETARKQSGSFYTPREIVNYMVDESLIAYLSNACPDIEEETIRLLFTQDDLPETLQNATTQRNKLVAAIKAAKMLDPACGSGAFPMGMLNRMLTLIMKLSTVDISVYETKLYLIENCIYGIDIQTIAVQITKLRFFISLICEQVPNENQEDNYGIVALPNLETNFVAANTLIGLAKKPSMGNLFENPEIEPTKKALKEIRHKHFSATNAQQKKEYRKQDELLREKLAKLLEENADYSPENAHQLADWNPYDQNASSSFFDAEWMFGIKNGFDLVIGNPPYVEVKQSNVYACYKTRKSLELYAYFFEKGVELLSKNGIISFITASLFIKGIKFTSLREYLENKTNVIIFRIVGDKVFENVQMPTVIFIGKRSDLKWSFSNFTPDYKLISQIEQNSIKVAKISRIMRGFEIGRDKVKNSGSYPILTGSNVQKYFHKDLSYIEENVKSEYEKDNFFFSGERILIRETGSEITSIYLEEELFSNRSLYSIKLITQLFSYKYIIGCINSKVLQFYYQTKFKNDTELFPKIRIAQVKELPIPNVTFEHQKRIIQLIDEILLSKNNNDILVFQKQIDNLVYKLYNLTYDEVKVIEPDIEQRLSEAEYNNISLD